MRLRNVIVFIFMSLIMVSNSYGATTTSNSFNAVQTLAIQKIVHDYLISNPQVLMDAANALQKQQQQQWQDTANKAVPEMAQQLFANSESPVTGNLKGDVTLVEFFDYQCPHCKEMAPEIAGLLSTDKNLRVVYKVFPIFGDNSEYAAKATLAAQKQGKFIALHEAIINNKNNRLTNDVVLKLAEQVGINTAQLQKDMKDPAVQKELKDNIDIGKKLQLTGTPAFVFAKVNVDDKTHTVVDLKNPILIPGAVDQGTLAEAIAEARGD